jgi:16S rRNA (adenine1518-N6/adenine1519-N6)-dimethyltransferase
LGRRLGQHFLKDPRILDRIVEALEPTSADVVLEVGTGAGDLTRRLADRVGIVHSIELDRVLFETLTHIDLKQNIKLYHGDALKFDWHDVTGHGPFKVIGNLPYYITSPLIDRALIPPCPEVIVFLVQAEVAGRLAAAPGTKAFGALSVGVRATANVEKLFTVKPGSFTVPPRVSSAVVRLRPRKTPLVSAGDRAAFRRFVNSLFSMRRKQLQRALKARELPEGLDVDRLLDRIGVDPAKRAESLTVEEFVTLFGETNSVD